MSIRHTLIALPLVAVTLAACSGPASTPGIAPRSAGANSAAERTAGQAQYKMVRLDTLDRPPPKAVPGAKAEVVELGSTVA